MIVGTLGKALGSYGAYVCGLRSSPSPRHKARLFIYSTAPPPRRSAPRWPRWTCSSPAWMVEQLRRNVVAILREALSAQGLATNGS